MYKIIVSQKDGKRIKMDTNNMKRIHCSNCKRIRVEANHKKIDVIRNVTPDTLAMLKAKYC